MSNDVVSINTKQELVDLLDNYDSVVLKFWAIWCGPCRAFAPHFKAAAAKMESNVIFAEADVDKSPELQEMFNVLSIPSVFSVYLEDDVIVYNVIKSRTAVTLLNELK